jgi:hypothetical protein
VKCLHIEDLFSESSNPKTWEYFLSLFRSNYNEFSSSLGKHLNEEDTMSILQYLLIAVARNGFETHERKVELFKKAEEFGVHILPVHFYSPVPNISELKERDFQHYESIGLEMNIERQWKFLEDWKPYFLLELNNIPLKKTSDDGEYYFNNPAYPDIDAMIYYSMIRHFKPKRVIEVGAGYSTMIAAKAGLKNETTEITVIDPYLLNPIEKGFRGLSKVINKKVQDVESSVFNELEENDILFIDSSHVSKIGSDVNHVILRILPLLNKGVIVHFHDIFFPLEVSKRFIIENQLYWNEQYLLHSFLLFNSHFEVLISNHYLLQSDLDKLKILIPRLPYYRGGSFWIRKTK